MARRGILESDMYARTLEDQSARLTELRHEEWGDFALGAAALGLAIVASVFHPPFALPLFFGGLVVGALGIRALWRRWDMLDRLSVEPDAYAISDVLDYARREATIKRRRGLAARLRGLLGDPGLACASRLSCARDGLEALAAELEDESLVLDPACAVDCSRLLGNPEESPLLNLSLPLSSLETRISRIRSGFSPAMRS